MLQLVQESLLEELSEDAHLRVSGKLSLSLTRASDGRNLLVSQFDSREELVQAMAEICQNGYMDTLRFLQENNLISGESSLRSLQADATERVCCDLAKDSPGGEKSSQRDHPWLDPRLIQNLPAELQRVLCKACRETHTAGGLLTHMTEYLPKKVTSYLPFDSARSVRVRGWMPDVPRDMRWLFGMEASKQTLKETLEYKTRPPRLRRCSSLPSDLRLWEREEEEEEVNLVLESPEGAAGVKSPPAEWRGWGLGRALGLLRNLGSEQTSDRK